MISRELIESYEELQYKSTDDEGIDNYICELTGKVLGYRGSTKQLTAIDGVDVTINSKGEETVEEPVRLYLSNIETEDEFKVAMKMIEWYSNEDIRKMEQGDGNISKEYEVVEGKPNKLINLTSN